MADLELHEAAIDDVADARDRNRRLRDVRREDHFPAARRRGLEDELLEVEGQRGEDGPDDEVLGDGEVDAVAGRGQRRLGLGVAVRSLA